MNAHTTLPQADAPCLLPTCIVVLVDDKTGRRIFDETNEGRDFRTLCHDLAGGHVAHGCSLYAVKLLDDAGERLTDVTVRVLQETARILECRDWSASRTLHAAYERHGLPVPHCASDDPDAGSMQAAYARGGRIAAGLYGAEVA